MPPEQHELMEKARALGKAIASSHVMREVRQAEQMVRQDVEARKLSEEQGELMERLATMEAENRPIGAEDRRKMAELYEKISSNPLHQRLLRAQVEYRNLLNRVSDAIASELGESLEQDEDLET